MDRRRKSGFDNVDIGVAKEQDRQPAKKNQRTDSMYDLSDSNNEADQEHQRDGEHAHATGLRVRIDLEFELYMAHKVSLFSLRRPLRGANVVEIFWRRDVPHHGTRYSVHPLHARKCRI